jgi:serine/threonine protein kinase
MLSAEQEKKKISEEAENEIQIGNSFTMVLNKKLGSGAFGEIFKGYNKKTNEEVAIKVESKKVKTPQLIYESKILKLLGGKGN